MLVLMLTLSLPVCVAQEDIILETTYNPADHSSPYYYDTLRDTANIYADLWNNITLFTNNLTKTYRNIVLGRDAAAGSDEEALLKDIYRYTDRNGAASADSAALDMAQRHYDAIIAHINSTTNFDTLYEKYATLEIRRKYRDIILDRVSDARKEIEGFQNLSSDAREEAVNDVQKRYWQTKDCIKEKSRERYMLAIKAEVLTAAEAQRDEIVTAKQKEYAEELRHSSLVYSAFSPVINELGARKKSVLSLQGKTFENGFNNEWYPWVTEMFPSYVEKTGGITITEKTLRAQRLNPHYDPNFERRVNQWKWLDDVSNISYETQNGYRIYQGYEQYKVAVKPNTGSLAVYSGNRLMAVSEGFEPISMWWAKTVLYEYILSQEGGKSLNLNEEQIENYCFKLKHGLPIDENFTQTILKQIDDVHGHDLEKAIVARESGLSFLHYVGKDIALRETYFQDDNANVFRSYEVINLNTMQE